MTNARNESIMKSVAKELSQIQGAFKMPGMGGTEFNEEKKNRALVLLIRYILCEQGYNIHDTH